MTNEQRDYIKYWIGVVNAETHDASLRDAAGIELMKAIYDTVGDRSRIEYHGNIHETYINYDSNCGLTVVSACIDFESIADYILENEDINTITLEDAARIMNEEFGERREWLDDLIDEDGFTAEEDHIMFVLDYIMEDEENCDEEFRQDLKDYKNRR